VQSRFAPFISLYLNAQADHHGRDNFHSFVRKEFTSRAKTFPVDSMERVSFERNAARVEKYLEKELQESANGVAIFACAGADNYFKAIQLDAPIRRNKLHHVSDYPHLYPLARLIDQHPRYAAVIADTEAARIFVFDLGQTKSRQELNNAGISRSRVGERSQMRYRRRVENPQQLHAKEIVEMLERVVRDETVEHIILAGDEVIIPLLRERLPAHLAEKVIDILRLDIRTPEHEILKATMEALHEDKTHSDAEKIRDLFDKSRAGGLAVVGLRDTLDALSNGQVDELLLNTSPQEIGADEETLRALSSDSDAAATGVALSAQSGESGSAAFAQLLVKHALLSGARITFIEDRKLLADVGGVGAFLRYRI
jgi:peptide subunit release factor 1 (eRF1)